MRNNPWPHGTHANDNGQSKLWLCTIMELFKANHPIKLKSSMLPPGIFYVYNLSLLFMKDLEIIFKTMPGKTIITLLDVKNNCINRDTAI